jgi:hypothetical protein
MPAVAAVAAATTTQATAVDAAAKLKDKNARHSAAHF